MFVILVISRFGFEGWSWVLIAPVPDICLLFATICLVYLQDSHDCKFDKSLVKATMSNWYGLKQGDEENLALAVAQIGPISCGMDAEKSFMLYAGGETL